MLKYLYMGTPEIAAQILERLCTDLYPPVAVVTQEAKAAGRGQKLTPSAVENYAKSQDLTVFSTSNVNAPPTVAALKLYQVDVIVVVAFGQILKKEVLEMPKLAPLNVHASLLPRYRGAAPVQRAIQDGELETGVTIQKMVAKLDAGDILVQKKTPIISNENSVELLGRLTVLGGEAMLEAFKLLESGKAIFTPQDETKVTYAKKLEKEEALIDWNDCARGIVNKIQAFNPWPVAQISLNGQKLKVYKAAVVGESKLKLGEIETDHKTWLHIGAGDSKRVSLFEVQQENRKRVSIAEFLSGLKGSDLKLT